MLRAMFLDKGGRFLDQALIFFSFRFRKIMAFFRHEVFAFLQKFITDLSANLLARGFDIVLRLGKARACKLESEKGRGGTYREFR